MSSIINSVYLSIYFCLSISLYLSHSISLSASLENACSSSNIGDYTFIILEDRGEFDGIECLAWLN
jgi:hypothetical protein